jgi:archaemetzincin
VKKTVYLGFINKYVPPFWRNLRKDLTRIIPFSYTPLTIEMELKPFYSPDRNQYNSSNILSEIIDRLPENGEKIIGITNVDIFIPILTFLFGEAQLCGRGALVSTHRLQNELYGLPGNNKLLYERTLKEVLHEFGHTLGLIHCKNFSCVMTSSSFVEGIDLKHAQFCRHCRARLNLEIK